MLAAVCKLNGKLSCIRVVCYDVIRSLHDVGVSALELVISVITVWPEVLQSFSKETPSLLYTLRMVLLFFVNKSSSTDLGNVLRRLCHWNDEPSCIENALKDRGLELAECLRNESLAVARLSQGEIPKCFFNNLNKILSIPTSSGSSTHDINCFFKLSAYSVVCTQKQRKRHNSMYLTDFIQYCCSKLKERSD